MRNTGYLLNMSRKPQLGPGPFKELLPLKLRNKLSGKGQKGGKPSCLFEMSVVFACLKTAEFKQDQCENEIAAFKKCYEADITARQSAKQRSIEGTIAPGETTNLTFRQVNSKLADFPAIYRPPNKA